MVWEDKISIMCYYQCMLLDAILEVWNGSSTSEVVGSGVGARICCDKQLLMSVDDKENCNPSALKPCSIPEEKSLPGKISVKTPKMIATQYAPQERPDCRSSQRLQDDFECQKTSLNWFCFVLVFFCAVCHKPAAYCSPQAVCSKCSWMIWAKAPCELSE